MASKSRLGKGLGALFPALPGEEPHEQHVVSRETLHDTTKQSVVLEQRQKAGTAESHNAPEHDAKTAKSVTAEQPQKPSGVVEEDAPVHIPSIKHAVSPHASTSRGRATMPGIEDIAHPSDMFFDDTVSLQSKRQSADETKKDKKQSDGKQQEQSNQSKLKPVEGGYLAELNLDEIGPNAHQPRWLSRVPSSTRTT